MRLAFVSVLASVFAATAAALPGQHVFGSLGGPGLHADMQPGTLYSEQRLVKVGENVRARWMGLEAIQVLRQAGVGFMDITDAQELHELHESRAAVLGYESELPEELRQEKRVEGAIGRLTTSLYGRVLEPFTAFHNRYYDSENGLKSSEFLKGQVEELVRGHNVTVESFGHKFRQPSVVARIPGASEETVVVSAHQDSVNMWLPWFGRASGADDDGSGTVTILEALRVLLAEGFEPRRTVEFHWYAGEEGGLLGSQDIAQAYLREGRKVAANMHFDMTGFWKGSEVLGLVADRTDPETRALVKKLTSKYTRLEAREFECGYGCSDHASWNTAGYRSAMAFESDDLEANTNIHSPKDTVDTLDFNHMLEFSKLAVAFAYEVGYHNTAK
ncbi:hypothetical protein GGF46_001456 [Coemansia sp. RSA 552]|nr:hypothetical protein GGF46_001456 [Coemansia sp. RSA 552]